MSTTTATQKETFGFQAEVGKVLDLVIHSLYSNKEIFLRELISNASDANDKLRFAALANSSFYGDEHELQIRVDIDKKARTVTISDNGIGMSREDVIEHLGTIAHSGTNEFLKTLTGDQSSDAHLIGQFGVGFYSAFIVADKVTVKTRKAGSSADQGVKWESDGTNSYTVEMIEKQSRGTEVILRLRQDMDEFLDETRLQNIIVKYSDHISWPIRMLQEKEEDGKTTQVDHTVNRATALWTLPKSQIKDDEYKELYKHISYDYEEPLMWLHNHVEGKTNYISLFYIPSHAPFDLWHPEFKHGLKLYVQRVFIMDDADKLLPRYLRFVKGIIDSSDLPLNVSREILQDNKLIDTIRAASAKKILTTLEKLSQDDSEKYQKFWDSFGQVMKEGPIEDYANRELLGKLMRFSSTHTDDAKQNISLMDYVKRMKENQSKIYYITAENFNAAKNSPHLEIFRKNNIEVLLLTERVDEWLVTHLPEFEGKTLQSVTKGNLDLNEVEEAETKEEKEKLENEFSSLIEKAKKILAEKVKDVRISHRLTHSPACVVADDYDIGLQMQRILKAAGQQIPTSKPILELNPEHPIVLRLKHETAEQKTSDWLYILLDQAILAEGGSLENSATFVERLNKMLTELVG